MAEEIHNTMHVGRLILAEMNRQGRNVTWLAKAINCDRRNVYNIFKRGSMDTDLLMRVSRALGHNFLQDMADAVEKEEKGEAETEAS